MDWQFFLSALQYPRLLIDSTVSLPSNPTVVHFYFACAPSVLRAGLFDPGELLAMARDLEGRLNEREIFETEYQVLDEAESALKNEELSRDDLRKAFKTLAKKYKSLLSQTVKITRIGDSTQSKLIKIQNQLDQQNSQLEAANLKLRELDQIKQNFTAMLVHDLKSPLSVVKGTLEFLSMDESLEETGYGELIRASEGSVQKILNLINEVLEVYKSEAQDMKLVLTPQNPQALLRECIVEAEVAGRAAGLTVVPNIVDDLPTISMDAGKLGRVFSNLLSNAVKFTPKGGHIVVEARTTAGTGIETGSKFLTVEITDTGEGIPAEELPFLFDPYRQAKSNKARLGVGLGLAIVKRIVAAHGGNIVVRSKLGVGTCFSVMIPAV